MTKGPLFLRYATVSLVQSGIQDAHAVTAGENLPSPGHAMYVNKPAFIWMMQFIKNLNSMNCCYGYSFATDSIIILYTKARNYKHWRYSYKAMPRK
jgi:hypothetical protein